MKAYSLDLRQKVSAAALRGDRTIREYRARRIEEGAEGRATQVLWLAPYSSDFSPIEQCWSKIKAYLRGAKVRTADAPDKGPAQAIGLVTKADIRGWFKHCGYSLARN